MEAPGGVEPPTNGLGNRCSIQLSYGAKAAPLSHAELGIRSAFGREIIQREVQFEHIYARFSEEAKIALHRMLAH